MAPRQRTHSSVADLLSCPTFLQRLSPAERSEIFSTARCSKPPGCLQNLPAEVEQLLQDKRLLQEQKQQLQAKITTLQYQVSMLLADNKGKEAQGDERLSALEIVIDQLQVAVADVGAIAARVAAENKVLLAENMQLSAEREQHLSNMLKLKEHRHQIEDKLGTGITAASQQAVGAAPGAATVGAAAMVITPVVAATAMPPNYDASSCSSIITQAHRNPALQEIASLGRARATLHKQVAELQQRLSAAEEKAQAAASTAASERARYGRELAKCQQRLEYSVQRLQVMADRGHQQQVAMQERERYIHKLEQCLLHQHEQLSQKAASAVAKLSNGKVQNTAAHRPATSNRQHVKGLLNSVCSSKRLPSAPQKQQLTAHIEAQDLAPGRAAAGSELDVNTGSQTGAVCAGMRSNHKEVSIPVQRDASAAAAAIPDSHPFATANAAQRTAVAQQCKHAMLSVSPQGRASRQRARIASAAAAEDEAEEAQCSKATGAVTQERHSASLQEPQQSKLQQWHLRPNLSRQQMSSAVNPVQIPATRISNTPVAAPVRVRPANSDNIERQVLIQGTPLQQQQRQRRLRELMRLKQQRLRPMQSKLQANQARQQQLKPTDQDTRSTRWSQQQQQCITNDSLLHGAAGSQPSKEIGSGVYLSTDPGGGEETVAATAAEREAGVAVLEQRAASLAHQAWRTAGTPCQLPQQFHGDETSKDDTVAHWTQNVTCLHDRLEPVALRNPLQDHLVSRVVDMQQNLQQLRGQLLQHGLHRLGTCV